MRPTPLDDTASNLGGLRGVNRPLVLINLLTDISAKLFAILNFH